MKNFNTSGYEYITSKIDEAIKDESRTATVSGAWEIAQAVRLPSNFTLILQDCHLRMADGCYSNMFVNEHHDTEIGRTIDGRDTNISIIGRGEAILDGGKYNGLSEKNHSKNGLPPIWKNNLPLWNCIFRNIHAIFGIIKMCSKFLRISNTNCAFARVLDFTFTK